MRILIILLLIITFGSCQKCSTCTFSDESGEKLTSEVCNSGKVYKDAIKEHEDNGWVCSEN